MARFWCAPTYPLRLLCRACCLPGLTLGRSAGVEPLEQVAPAMCQSLIMDGISARLPGLLIPSDFSIIFDGVSIGGEKFSTRETLQVIYARCASFIDARLRSRLLAAPAQGSSHTGQRNKSVVLGALASLPRGGLPLSRRCRSLVRVGGWTNGGRWPRCET